MVSLGLIGTLWGIIMIGYYPQKDIQMSTLMICLHTALFSTLVAVVWVFIVAMALRPAMQWWNRFVHGHTLPPMEEDLLQVLDKLSVSAANAGNGFNSANTEITGLKKQIVETRSEFKEVIASLREFRERTGVDIFKAVETSCTEISTSLKGMNVEFRQFREAGISMQDTVRQMSSVIQKESQMLHELESRLKRIEQEKDEAMSKVEKAVSDRIEAQKTAEFAEKRQNEVQAQLSKIKDALH
jgi:chromosome segregation ATPase